MIHRRLQVALGALVLAAALTTGCSENKSASKACAAVADGEVCKACCSANGATGHKYATGSSCDCLGGTDKPVAAAPAPASPAAVSFAGSYKSAWGATVFTQAGNVVTAAYPNGTMTCNAAGPVLDCAWREAAGAGKALLTKNADGTITGTWGKGASATDGGPWVFTL